MEFEFCHDNVAGRSVLDICPFWREDCCHCGQAQHGDQPFFLTRIDTHILSCHLACFCVIGVKMFLHLLFMTHFTFLKCFFVFSCFLFLKTLEKWHARIIKVKQQIKMTFFVMQ